MPQSNNKVLIATGIYPPDIGGPATILQALADSLVKRGFAIKILTYSNQSNCQSDQNICRISRKQNSILSYLKYFLKMKSMADWADVIYVTDVYSVGYFAYLLKKLKGKKYIVRFAGDSAWEKAVAKGLTKDYIVDFQNKTYGRKIEKLKERRKKILIKADKIIAVSQFMASIARKIGASKDKVKVVYNSVDFLQAGGVNEQQVQEIKSKFGQNAKIIVTACRLNPWKGVDGIIKIVPRLKEKIGNFNLLVLGDGAELDNLRALAEKLNINDNVHFLGRIEHKEMVNYFKAADLFILNSNYEGLSHTLLEVIKAGTPIIASNVGGNPEVIDNGQDGLLVSYNNEPELLAASLKILSDLGFAGNLTEKAKEKIKKFNWQNTIEQTAQTIKEI